MLRLIVNSQDKRSPDDASEAALRSTVTKEPCLLSEAEIRYCTTEISRSQQKNVWSVKIAILLQNAANI